jgi:hypothetical protein
MNDKDSIQQKRSTLTLKRTYKSPEAGPWSTDEYDVFDDGRCVGRIILSQRAPDGEPWFWIVTAPEVTVSNANQGYAASREQAMADLKARFKSLADG